MCGSPACVARERPVCVDKSPQDVLDALRSIYPLRALHYWRDKSQREIDFVVQRSGGNVDAIEAKISPNAFTTRLLRAFRQHHPRGANILVCPFVDTPYTIRQGGFELQVCSTAHLSAGSRIS